MASEVCFTVKVETFGNLKVFVTGDCAELGEWQPNKAKPLKSKGHDVWGGKVLVTPTKPIKYRYFTGYKQCVGEENKVMVHSWEAHSAPRLVVPSGKSMKCDEAVFGQVDAKFYVERGTLTGQSEIHLSLCSNSVSIQNVSFTSTQYYIQCNAVNMRKLLLDNCGNDANNVCFSSDVLGCVLDGHHDVPSRQPEKGIPFKLTDFVTFSVQSYFAENLAFEIRLLSNSSDLPTTVQHIGSTFVLPARESRKIEVPLLSNQQAYLGSITADILIINSFAYPDTNAVFTPYEKRATKKTQTVGHRGMGSSNNSEDTATVRENTFLSLEQAAQNGADLVEFDVMLSKDKVPVLYHDYFTIVKAETKDGLKPRLLTIPVQDLTIDELHAVSVCQAEENLTEPPECKCLDSSNPFPTLKQCLQDIDPRLGFNAEIKYCMELDSGGLEEGISQFAERNQYVDAILQDLFQFGANRQIVLSCFDPDVCSMLRAKQNKYPILFLTQGATTKYPAYKDWRTTSVLKSFSFACSESLHGVSIHTEELLKDMKLIKQAQQLGLLVYCWGEENNNRDTFNLLKKHAVSAIIYDKLLQFK